jgi:hypothetical protein
MENTDCHDQVEGSILEWKLLSVGLKGHDAGGQIVPRNVDRIPDVDSNDSCAESMRLVAVPAGPGTDI